MDDEINAVRVALNRFATQFQAEDQLHWGLVVGPRENAARLESLDIIANISPFAQFLAAFAALGMEGMDTGSEMLRDAIYLAVRNISGQLNYDLDRTLWDRGMGATSNPTIPEFFINWREETDKIIIVFSDEEDQSYLVPNLRPEVLVGAIANTPGLKLYVFHNEHNQANWPDIANAGSGQTFVLSNNHVQMYEDLMSIIDEACLGPREADVEEVSHTVVHYDHIRMVCE